MNRKRRAKLTTALMLVGMIGGTEALADVATVLRYRSGLTGARGKLRRGRDGDAG